MPWACIEPDNTTNLPSNGSKTHEIKGNVELVRYNIYAIVIPILMVIGIIGNSMNLIILTRRRLRRRMDVMEQSATTGLAFLFLYELLLCSVLLPYPYFLFHGTSHASSIGRMVTVYYNSYHAVILNIFLFTCTWVTVVISVERYIAVCHVLKARYIIRIKRTITTHVVVLVLCIGFSLIELVSKLKIWRSFPTCKLGLLIRENYDVTDSVPYKVYLISRSVLGVLVPFIVLAYCNIKIILTISRRNTAHLQEGTNRQRPQARTTTITLIGMVLSFFVLVFPNLIYQVLNSLGLDVVRGTSVIIAEIVLNMCQAINFSISFLLYFVLCPEFRHTATSICNTCFRCQCFKTSPKLEHSVNGSASKGEHYELVGDYGSVTNDHALDDCYTTHNTSVTALTS